MNQIGLNHFGCVSHALSKCAESICLIPLALKSLGVTLSPIQRDVCVTLNVCTAPQYFIFYLSFTRMIDFAHVFEEPHVDENYVFGLRNLIASFRKILKKM